LTSYGASLFAIQLRSFANSSFVEVLQSYAFATGWNAFNA